MNIRNIYLRISSSRFVKDSLWAILGSGGGYALILLSGIIVAVFLGSSRFGEYGFIKSTMFQFATFATLGLHFTSTKFIAQSRQKNPGSLASIAKSALSISSVTSLICALAILIFASPIASILNHKEFARSLQFMGAIIIFRSIATTQYGILAGFGDFRIIGRNNILSGFVMLIVSLVGVKVWGLSGALFALALSQFFNLLLNWSTLRAKIKKLPEQYPRSYVKEELIFTFPIALQDISANLGNFFLIILLTRFSSLTQLGLYTAAQQWYVVAIFVPSLLQNVILSHLSKDQEDKDHRRRKFKNIVKATFFATIITSVILIGISPLITGLYGHSFQGLTPVIIILLCFATISCLTGVFKSELISSSHIWQLFTARILRDGICIITCFIILQRYTLQSSAFWVSLTSLVCEIIYLILLWFIYIYNNRH